VKNKGLLITGIILVAVLAGFIGCYLYASTTISKRNTTISNLQNQVASDKAQIAPLEAQLSSANSEVSSLRTQLSSANSQISDLQSQLSSANSQVSSLTQDNAQLKEIITPSKPTHNLSPVAYNVSSTYWNLAWAGRDAELQETTRQVNAAYFQLHTYIANETDCNDMAVDIWDMLRKQGITSIIGVGNLDMTGETWLQCNHAWLMIANSSGQYFALEPTNGQLYFQGDPQASQYTEGFFYANPSDLRADVGSRW
jgi:cell division protein FtsL